MYEGERVFTCTSYSFGRKWCATTYDYDKDGEWGQCLGWFTSYHTTPSSAFYDCLDKSITINKTLRENFKNSNFLVSYLVSRARNQVTRSLNTVASRRY